MSASQERQPALPDPSQLREFPLGPLAAYLGCRQDPGDPRRWRRPGSILSIDKGKFFDHKAKSGGYGAIDLVAHARSWS